MKQKTLSIAALALVASLVSPAIAGAQQKEVIVEGYSTKTRNGGEQITITRKSDTTGKTIIVVDGENITVNGKPVQEGDENVTVHRRKLRDVTALTLGGGNTYNISTTTPNSAVLGVTTESTDDGIKILTVSKGSGAEKAGLKKGDVITAIDDKTVSSPNGLSRLIHEKKPGDKVSVAYTRSSKKEKVTAELGRMEEITVTGYRTFNDLALNFDDQNISRSMDQLGRLPQMYGREFNAFGSGGPKLGLTVQDTDDGKGVKVLNVSDDGNAAKAGIQEEDVILEVDGKAVNGADEIAKVMKDSKDLVTVKFKYQRNGKTNTTDVRIPRKLKTANL